MITSTVGVKNDYSPHYRGCLIKVQVAKKKSDTPWIEGQVRMPDKSMLYVQSEPTKILLLREARRMIDAWYDKADLWGRWLSRPLV